MEYQEACFVPVKEKCQFDGIYHAIHALSPADVYIIMSETQSEEFSHELDTLRQRLESFMTKETSQGWTTLKMRLTPRFRDVQDTKDLRIIFDSSVPKDSYFREKAFTIFLMVENGNNNLGCNLPLFSPLTFLSFQQFVVKFPQE